uniref:PiggyBac transposable element-derived protein domain-containing protein n=1 Tax=Ditylenchus dipsaci TaxID=166011 RepID=A0A915DTW8_9BILA
MQLQNVHSKQSSEVRHQNLDMRRLPQQVSPQCRDLFGQQGEHEECKFQKPWNGSCQPPYRELTDAGRTIVCDNFFTSPELGQSLWQKNTCLLGTVRSNRKGMPKEFVKEELEVQNTKYAYKKQESLMKLQVANNMSVFLYSTFHHRAAFNKKAKKPVVVSDYNKAKCDNALATKCESNECLGSSSKQTKLVNADAGKRRSFLFSLSKQLMEVQQQNHSRSENYLNAEFRKIAEANANIEKKVRGNLPSPAFWCPICKTTKRKSVECQKCRRQICIDDVVQMVHCKDCQTHSPPRKVAAVPAKLYHSKPNPICKAQGRKMRIVPTNQKVNSAQRCKLCDNPMCPLHRSAANNLFCLRCG